MANPKPKFKKGQTFYHAAQNIFVMIDTMDYYEGEGRGWLYNLKCFKHEHDQDKKPWKRYYEAKMLSELTPLKSNNAVKVLYGS